MKNKCFNVFLLLFCVTISLFACKNDESIKYPVSDVSPNLDKRTDEINLDFTIMHNYVIDSITDQFTPFFFIKNGEFDISGDNKNKVITISCTCLDKTTIEDLDLFLSLVLQYMGFSAAEQDFRFSNPKTDETGTFIDFGTLFNSYDLIIKSKTESGTVLRDDYIKKGSKIPIDSRYWSE